MSPFSLKRYRSNAISGLIKVTVKRKSVCVVSRTRFIENKEMLISNYTIRYNIDIQIGEGKIDRDATKP